MGLQTGPSGWRVYSVRLRWSLKRLKMPEASHWCQQVDDATPWVALNPHRTVGPERNIIIPNHVVFDSVLELPELNYTRNSNGHNGVHTERADTYRS